MQLEFKIYSLIMFRFFKFSSVYRDNKKIILKQICIALCYSTTKCHNNFYKNI